MTSNISDTSTYTPLFDFETKTSEYSTTQRAIARATKWGRFSERDCFACGSPLRASELHKSYSLHHEYRKGSPNYNLLIFVHLVHPGCHGRLGPAIEKAQPQKTEREIPEQGYGEPDHSDPSAYAVSKNADEDAVRQTVIEHLLRMGPDPGFKLLYALQLKNMVNAVAEELDFSQATLYRYFGRMLNPINGFLAPRSKRKVAFLGFRRDDYYSLGAKEIMKMHPKRGQLYRQEHGEK